MKFEEKIAKRFLEAKGYKKIVFEPDGKIPPDFLIEDSIAIEVRRLNKHVQQKGKKVPIENLEYSLIRKIRKIIESYQVINFENSILVSLNYSRPLVETQSLKSDILSILDIHTNCENEKRIYQVIDNLSLKFTPFKKKLDSFYHVGAQHDDDAGGFVVANIYDNLEPIIKEKEEKVKSYRGKYSHWWLILIDYIGYGIDPYDMNQLKDLPRIKSIFNRIFIIPPMSPELGLEY